MNGIAEGEGVFGDTEQISKAFKKFDGSRKVGDTGGKMGCTDGEVGGNGGKVIAVGDIDRLAIRNRSLDVFAKLS